MKDPYQEWLESEMYGINCVLLKPIVIGSESLRNKLEIMHSTYQICLETYLKLKGK